MSFIEIFNSQNLFLVLSYVCAFLSIFLTSFFMLFDKKSLIFSLVLCVLPVLFLLLPVKSFALFSADQVASFYLIICILLLLFCICAKRVFKYKTKTNAFIFLAKLPLMAVLFVICFVCVNFAKSVVICYIFIACFSIFVPILLAFLFKKIDKKLFVFSGDIDEKKTIFSMISFSKWHTHFLSKKLQKYIQKGDTIFLCGDLGAGKSEIVRGYLTHSAVMSKITSPTFTLVNEYTSKKGEHFYHFDLYRIEDENEVKNLDFEEIVDKSDAIKFIEWPQRAESFLPEKYKKITIVKLGKSIRNIIFEDYSKD